MLDLFINKCFVWNNSLTVAIATRQITTQIERKP